MRVNQVLMAAAVAVAFTANCASAQAPPAKAPAPAPAAAKPAAPAKVEAPRKQEMAPVAEGAAVPDIKVLYAFENKMASLKEIVDTKGKSTAVTVVTFVNTACASCLGEAKTLQDIEDKNPGKMLIVTVVTDRNADRVSKMLGDKDKIVYLLDPFFSSPPVFGFKSTPGLVVIKGGKVMKLISGYVPSDEGAAELEALLTGYMK